MKKLFEIKDIRTINIWLSEKKNVQNKKYDYLPDKKTGFFF